MVYNVFTHLTLFCVGVELYGQLNKIGSTDVRQLTQRSYTVVFFVYGDSFIRNRWGKLA